MIRPLTSPVWPILLSILATPAAAQGFGVEQHASAELFVRVVGDQVQAVVEIDIDQGWHLYHDDLGPSDAVGKPTQATFDAPGVEWGAAEFSEPHRYEQLGLGDGGADTWIWGHEGRLLIRVAGEFVDQPPSPDEVVVELSGLICEDGGVCIPYRDMVDGQSGGPDDLFAAFEAPTAQVKEFDPAPGLGLGFGLGADGPRVAAELELAADGDRVLAAITFEVAQGWHLYHDDLGAPDAVGVATSIALSVPGVEFGPLRFPEPERLEQPGLGDGGRDTWILAHEGTFVVTAQGRGSLDIGSASAQVSGQVCEDGGLCVPYEEQLLGRQGDFEALAALIAAAPAAEGGGTAGAEPGDRAAEAEQGDGLAAFLSLAVFWGLFTLLMPCTYPMIPITISFFTKQAEARGGKVLPLALAYGAGIVGIFVAIGVVVGPAVIRFATDPFVNLLIGLAFAYFALVLFGAINLNPPRFLMDAAGKASSKGGLIGVFLMGATLVITSFTCTAPFVGSLLSVGSTGEGASIGRIALGMGTFGATMAVPFVILSLLPGRIAAIPRAGAWMNTLKVSLGFIELAAALKFLSNADLVWHWQFLSRELFLVLWMGIFLTGALYLFGFVRLKGEGGDVGPGRMVAALGFLLFALYCGYGASGRQLDRIMTAIEPPYSGTLVGGPVGRADQGPREHTIVVDDYDKAVALALEQDKLLMVNFTGHTCVNCRQMERLTFPAEAVAAELVPHFVEARLHTDGEVNIDRILELQAELAGTVANPFYVLLDPRSGERLADGAFMAADRFAAFLRGARESASRG
jgi:thiol:disulfide interchange protein